MGNFLLDLFFPPKCVFCGKLLQKHEKDVCLDCLYNLPETDKTRKIARADACVAPLRYTGCVREAIMRYKFSGRSYYAPTFGRLLCRRLGETDAQLVTWIPVSRRRYFSRGYDQSQLIAREVAAQFGVPCVRTLQKRHTKKQSQTANAAERIANIAGAFRPYRADAFANKRILLIDDVCTTGATMTEAVRVLKTAGAEHVMCAALAITEE